MLDTGFGPIAFGGGVAGPSVLADSLPAVLRIRDVLSRIRPLLHPGSGIRGVKKHRIPDPTYFCIKAINKFCLLIPDPDPTIAPNRIPEVKKHRIPDPEHCLPVMSSLVLVFFMARHRVLKNFLHI
jgi:hypothetical protein